VWTEGAMFIFKNRRTEDRCELTIDEVMDLGNELIGWAVRLNGYLWREGHKKNL